MRFSHNKKFAILNITVSELQVSNRKTEAEII